MGHDTQERERRPFWHPLPCSQLRSVATLTPIIRANSLCDFPSLTRTAFTTAGRNVNVRDGFRASRRMRPACRTLAANALTAAPFVEIPSVRRVSERLRILPPRHEDRGGYGVRPMPPV
jgi:hypothetical protein